MKRIDIMIQDLNCTYELYARKMGVNNTAMYIFYLIYVNDYISQRQICDFTKYPKQTVNTVVMAYQRDGYIEMVEDSTDRRRKILHLTPKGMEFCEQVLPPIINAEKRAFDHFSKDKQHRLMTLFGEYNQVFQEELAKSMESLDCRN